MQSQTLSRTQMGGLLAAQLLAYTGCSRAVLLAIPRGGIVVGAAIARRLNLPLEALPARRFPVPGFSDVTLGAIAGGGELVFNSRIQRNYAATPAAVDAVIAEEREELERWERLYRDGRPLELRGRTAIVIDDAVVTGATMRAALAAVHAAGARRAIIATPIMATGAYVEVRQEADALVGLRMANSVPPLDEFYAEHRAVTEAEALAQLDAAGSEWETASRR